MTDPIIVTVEDGIATVYNVPPGVVVEVRDYDRDGDLDEDEWEYADDDPGHRHPYVSSVYE